MFQGTTLWTICKLDDVSRQIDSIPCRFEGNITSEGQVAISCPKGD
jgi:hypothetical protein